MTSPRDVDADLRAIPAASIEELRHRWRAAFGHAPPQRLSRKLLELAAAYQAQEQAFGGLSLQTKAALRRHAEELRQTGALTLQPSAPKLKPGVRLVRVWRGESHVVSVLDRGFLYRDDRFGSLSEIARAITGTQRSGPAFFGLRGGRRRRADGARLEAP